MLWQQIVHGSNEYQAACRLRQEILRTPLGLQLSPEELAAEDRQWHFGLFSDTRELLACLVIVPAGTDFGKLRQMAVRTDCQGLGLGQKLVGNTELFVKNRGMKTLELHARVSAVPFYEKLGYHCCGHIFTEVGIPHRKMHKTL